MRLILGTIGTAALVPMMSLASPISVTLSTDYGFDLTDYQSYNNSLNAIQDISLFKLPVSAGTAVKVTPRVSGTLTYNFTASGAALSYAFMNAEVPFITYNIASGEILQHEAPPLGTDKITHVYNFSEAGQTVVVPSSYIGTGMIDGVELLAGAQAGPPSVTDGIGTARIDGAYALTYEFNSPQEEPLVAFHVIDENGKPVTVYGFDQTNIDNSVGTITNMEGSGTVTRSDGTRVALVEGLPIFVGDKVRTDIDGAVNITFQDSSTVQMGDDGVYEISPYIYDPSPKENSNWSALRAMLVGVSGIMDQNGPDTKPIPIGGPGIRGDAADVVRDELLSNPQSTLYGDVGIWAETASPKSVGTIIETPGSPFSVSFDYWFLNPDMTLTVSLAGTDIWNTSSNGGLLGQRLSNNILIDWNSSITDLMFTFDGPSAGLAGLLANIRVNGDLQLDFDSWFDAGNGDWSFVLLSNEEQRTALAAASPQISAVPLGGSLIPLLIGLFSLGGAGLAKRRSV